jgi:hypothetical protein
MENESKPNILNMYGFMLLFFAEIVKQNRVKLITNHNSTLSDILDPIPILLISYDTVEFINAIYSSPLKDLKITVGADYNDCVEISSVIDELVSNGILSVGEKAIVINMSAEKANWITENCNPMGINVKIMVEKYLRIYDWLNSNNN